MKPERIEELLRQRPPDEPLFTSGLELAQAPVDRVRGRGPSLGGAGLGSLRWASLAVLSGLAIVVGSLVLARGTVAPSASPNESPGQPTTPPGAIAWIDQPYAIPTPEPTADPAWLPACPVDDLLLLARGWGGATGSAAGGAQLVNLYMRDCSIGAPVEAALLDANGKTIALSTSLVGGFSSDKHLVAVPAAGVVGAIVVWQNWCGASPAMPLTLALTLPGATPTDSNLHLTAEVQNPISALLPRCDSPGAGSTIGLLPFEVPGPPSGGYEPQPCSPSDLAAWSGDWGIAMGTEYSEVSILNVSGLDCTFPSGPSVELRDSGGTVVVSTQPSSSAGTFVLPAGAAAASSIAFSDWCIAPPELPLSSDIVLGNARLEVTPNRGEFGPIPVPPCNSQPETPPPGFEAGPFDVAGTPEPPPSDPGDILPMGLKLSPLPVVAPGSVLVYTVTLTNISAYDKPMNLSAFCPSYVQRLFLPGSSDAIETRLALNCAPAGIMNAGSTATFEMRLAIPADAPPGTATLAWQLGDTGPGVKTRFQIATGSASP